MNEEIMRENSGNPSIIMMRANPKSIEVYGQNLLSQLREETFAKLDESTQGDLDAKIGYYYFEVTHIVFCWIAGHRIDLLDEFICLVFPSSEHIGGKYADNGVLVSRLNALQDSIKVLFSSKNTLMPVTALVGMNNIILQYLLVNLYSLNFEPVTQPSDMPNLPEEFKKQLDWTTGMQKLIGLNLVEEIIQGCVLQSYVLTSLGRCIAEGIMKKE